MNISTKTIEISTNNNYSMVISCNKLLTESVTKRIRLEILEAIHKGYEEVYLDTIGVNLVDLSGINEIIHSHYTLQQKSKKLILVYKRNTVVSNWVETVGLNRFLDSAIVC